ncbi:MAG: serine/threonine protein kinase [Myxococcales bacterium]|nr:serine/threonine protein kinase [Myxococcales bacterium]
MNPQRPGPRAPHEIGGYRLLEFLGRGGMGEVWLAHDLRLDKPCVLKILRPRLARDHRYRRRFFHEAEICKSLGHGRIVPALDIGEAEGYLYLVMMFIDGVDLGAFCRALAQGGDGLPFVAVGYIIGEVFEALEHAHRRTRGGRSRAVIHRDVTPSNVLVSSEGEVFLTDFGIARFESERCSETYGTLQYMAPEQARGQACFASDVYGAAGVLHFMLTGRAPHDVASVEQLLASVGAGPPATGRFDVPEPLERIRAMGLEPDPERRLGSASEALAIIDQWAGYRKATRMLELFYRRYIGPPRSGLSGAMRAAAEAAMAKGRTSSAPVAQEPQAPVTESERMTVKVARDEPDDGERDDDARRWAAEGVDAEHDEDEDDGAWNRRWWRDDDDALESCPTRRYPPPRQVEPDAPRMLRRPHRRPLDPPIDVDSGSWEAR